ncbi:hypothetical protein N0V93_008641 [Gnomoniopsis smithogilvyi]|uniref:Uncharacterized protein n=1 Tax=Gnomoniopsis smithogilvyi TaxID=1191159 RepID=A0A9W9CU35_9PEZI|nr:hypothetical protein N0V93_008641 [Gnomoniopsis smithogilvyi]
MGKTIHRDVEVEVQTQGTISGCEYDVVIYDMVHQNLTPHMEVANKWCVALTRAIQGEIIIMHPGMKESPGFKDGRAIGKTYETTFASRIYQSCINRDALVQYKRGFTPGRRVTFAISAEA